MAYRVDYGASLFPKAEAIEFFRWLTGSSRQPVALQLRRPQYSEQYRYAAGAYEFIAYKFERRIVVEFHAAGKVIKVYYTSHYATRKIPSLHQPIFEADYEYDPRRRQHELDNEKSPPDRAD